MFCTTFKTSVRKMLHEFDSYVDTHVTLALQVTTALKNVLTSPVTEILTAIIPGDVDELIRTKLITALDKAIEVLGIVDSCKQYTDTEAKLQCFAAQLKQRDPELQDALLQKMASLLAGTLDDQRLQQHLYDLYTQVKYSVAK